MYSEEDLDSAVAAGAISAEAAAALRRHVAGLTRTPVVDEEHFRLVTGFNDIFVVIAGSLLLGSVAWIGASVKPWIGALATSACAWMLAEFFTRRRRMALPSILLLLAFVGGAFLASLLPFADHGIGPVFASGVAAAAAWLHWRRFRVPITVAAGTGALVCGALLTTLASVRQSVDWFSTLLFASGVVVFAVALRWDASDTRRETRRSDVAFWLHLLAAPLLVHPVFKAIGVGDGETSIAQTLLVAALYVVIALVSLCIDRRALMVSALGYVVYAFAALLRQTGMVSLSFAVTALVIGSALLLLSAFWHESRTVLISRLPASLQSRLAPLR